MRHRKSAAVFLTWFVLVGAASAQATVRITLEQAIDLAISHNHALKATQLQIQQNQAQELTASLRPNPTLTWDALFLPIEPQNFNTSTLLNTTEFDLGVGYLGNSVESAAGELRRRATRRL